MQKTLYSLIELQEVDKRLDELMEERGDLPLIVEELQAKVDQKKEDFDLRKNELKESKVRQRELELEMVETKEKLAKYEEQLYQVKTNKEYDAITTETETAKEEIQNRLIPDLMVPTLGGIIPFPPMNGFLNILGIGMPPHDPRHDFPGIHLT